MNPTPGTSRQHPNVVFVIADQWRACATGYAGNPDVKTPHLDALAAEAVNFENAVSCCPVCGPARASLLTGQYPLAHGIFANDIPMNPGCPSLAAAFNAAGYHTGWIGKWHVDGHGRTTYIPPDRRKGFQYFKALECTHDYHHSAYYDNDDPAMKYWDGYDAAAQTRDAIDFIHANRRTPFLLFLSWGPPHEPYFTAPGEYRRLYHPETLTIRSNVPPPDRRVPLARTEEKAPREEDSPACLAAGYYAHCTALDHEIGRLRAAIRDAGIEGDTLFIFTSDHGDMLGSQGLWSKQQPYDESIRVPFLVKLPLQSGALKCGSPVSSPDILPTLCDLCGVGIPEGVQGRSFAAAARGRQPSGDDATLIANYHAFGQWPPWRGGKEWRGIRTTRHTYARDLDGPWLLFDNETDPYQMDNLANHPGHAALQRGLDDRLREKLRQTNDHFEPGMAYVARRGYQTNKNGNVIIPPSQPDQGNA